MKIIGFIGLPGSGKGEASRIAKEAGLIVLVMGDIIRQEASRQGLEPTDLNLGRIGNALRAEEGPDVVAKRILDRARASGEEVVVVDGLRSPQEAAYFAAHAEDFHLVEICAPAEARLKWLKARGRPDDPGRSQACCGQREDGDGKIIVSCEEPDRKAAEALEERECRELGWGMCEAMKTADMKLRNDGSLVEFRKNVRSLFAMLAVEIPSGMIDGDEQQ